MPRPLFRIASEGIRETFAPAIVTAPAELERIRFGGGRASELEDDEAPLTRGGGCSGASSARRPKMADTGRVRAGRVEVVVVVGGAELGGVSREDARVSEKLVRDMAKRNGPPVGGLRSSVVPHSPWPSAD